MSEENKALIERAAESQNARDREKFLACYSDELIVWTGDDDRHVTVGPDEHWERVMSWAERFDGFTGEVQQVICEDDRVFVRSRYSGTHTGAFRGVTATGAEVEWEVWQVLRIRDGLIGEERTLMDDLDLLRQIDAIELPGSDEEV